MSSIYGDELISMPVGTARYYYSFQNYIEASTGGGFANNWSGVFYNDSISTFSQYSTITSNAYVNKLLTDYLIPKHWKDIVRVSTTDVTSDGSLPIWNAEEEDLNELFLETDLKLWYTLAKSYEKYIYLLDLYKSQLATLFNGVSKTTYNAVTDATTNNIGARTKTSRTNETPQNGGNFDDDLHTSEISKDQDAATLDASNSIRTGSIDISSPAYEKFDKIQNMIKKVYDDWASEFEKCFYDLGGIE